METIGRLTSNQPRLCSSNFDGLILQVLRSSVSRNLSHQSSDPAKVDIHAVGFFCSIDLHEFGNTWIFSSRNMWGKETLKCDG